MTTLEKIRAEIAEIAPLDYPCDKRTPERIRDMALDIIDKYAEQEPTDTWSIKDVADTFKKHGLIREQEPCDDVVSRQAVLDTEYQIKEINGIEYVMLSEVQMKIRKMPSVRPQETVTEFADRCRECGARYGKLLKAKTGYWKNKEFRKEEYVLMGTCSKCGKVRVLDGFCSNCGARMIKRESEESNADSN